MTLGFDTTFPVMTLAMKPFTTRAFSLANCLLLYLLPFTITYIAALPYILNGLESRRKVRNSCVAVLAIALGLHARADVLVWRENCYPWVGMFISMVLCGVQWIVIEAVLGLKQKATSSWFAQEVEEARRRSAAWPQDEKLLHSVKEEPTILHLP